MSLNVGFAKGSLTGGLDAAPPPGGVLLTSPVLGLRHTAGPCPAGGATGSAGLAGVIPFSACALLTASATVSPGCLSILGLAAVGVVAGVEGAAGAVVGVVGVPAGGLVAAGADPGNGWPGLFLITAGTFTLGGIVGATPEGVTIGGFAGGFGDPFNPFIIALPALAT